MKCKKCKSVRDVRCAIEMILSGYSWNKKLNCIPSCDTSILNNCNSIVKCKSHARDDPDDGEVDWLVTEDKVFLQKSDNISKYSVN